MDENTLIKGKSLREHIKNTIGISLISNATADVLADKLSDKFIELYDDIKQNLEYLNHFDKQHPKLIPFDLEKAKNGATVKTRNYLNVRILCDDALGEYPIVALIECDGAQGPISYTINGSCFISGAISDNDLMLVDEDEPKETYFLNIYKDSSGIIFSGVPYTPGEDPNHNPSSAIYIKKISFTI